MLSAFTARPIVEFKQRDKSKIESILAYGDRVFVGLNTGTLRIYRINEIPDEEDCPPDTTTTATENGNAGSDDVTTPPPPAEPQQEQQSKQARAADLFREEEKFSRRPVQQLAMIKEANTLLSLSDGFVSIHDLQSYALQERLEKTKGATIFAVTSNIVKDPSTGIPSIVSRLAVAVKRRILLWSWQDMEADEDVGEVTLIAAVKSLTWASGTKLVVGMDPGFVLVDIESNEITDIVKPGGSLGEQSGTRFGAVTSGGMGYMGMGGWVPKPMSTRLAEGQLLLSKDVNTLFIDTDGKALDKRQIPWAAAPEAIAYSYPYMLALQAPGKGALEVRSPETLSLLQTISLPNATLMHVPQPNISLAHAGKGFLVASDRCIWRMAGLPYDSQIDELVENGQYDEAISLLNMVEDTLVKDKESRLREIKIQKAQSLFDQRKYRDALDLFGEAKAEPERVIALYPKSIAGELSSIGSTKEEDSEPEPESEDANEANKTAAPAPASIIGRSMLGRFMAAESKKADSDTASVRSVRISEHSDTASIKGKTTADNVNMDKPLEGKDLVRAVSELRSFLAQTRTQLKEYIGPEDGKLKQPIPPIANGQDEQAQPPFARFILPRPQDEAVDWEERLREVASLVDTALFRAYMLVSPSMAGFLFRLPNFCDPEVVNEKLYESGRYADLIEFLNGKKLHREALELLAKFGKEESAEEGASALKGPQRTVAYLQQLPPEMIDLIVEFAEWPLKTEPELGMEIFLADTENAETLPRHRVVDFLLGIDNKLAVRYLEHIVNELNDTTTEFHQRLIELYLKELREDNFEKDEDRMALKEKLEAFLRTSSQYNKARVFTSLPSDDPTFYEAAAIVLSKMGQHHQALKIYVFQLQDHEKAEMYCNKIYLAEIAESARSPSSSPTSSPTRTPRPRRRSITPAMKEASPDPEEGAPTIYHTLLSLYLNPPPPHSPQLEPALQLLATHGARLPAASTLSLIPESLAVKELEPFLRGRIRTANRLRVSDAIGARLWAIEKVRVDAELSGPAGRGRRVRVGENGHCGVCGKRFGNSAVRVLPVADGGAVVHYGCFKRRPG